MTGSRGRTQRNAYPIDARRLDHLNIIAGFLVRGIVVRRRVMPVAVAPARAWDDSSADEVDRLVVQIEAVTPGLDLPHAKVH